MHDTKSMLHPFHESLKQEVGYFVGDDDSNMLPHKQAEHSYIAGSFVIKGASPVRALAPHKPLHPNWSMHGRSQARRQAPRVSELTTNELLYIKSAQIHRPTAA